MGRRKKIEHRLKTGIVYKIDRRLPFFYMYRNVSSRQHSRNDAQENLICFDIMPAPVDSTLMVLEHVKLFGRHYVKVMAANSEDTFEMGYMELDVFLPTICGVLFYE